MITNIETKSPNLVIIGNIAYDEIDLSQLKQKRENIIDIGGACVFSTIPASMFYRVGMVGKIGKDLDISKFYGYNIDLCGVKKLSIPTTKFSTIWNSEDGQDRTVTGQVKKEMEIGSDDIPKKFLAAKHFHLTTATPEKQIELIEFIRKNTTATISVDTIDEFADQPKCKEVFDSVDIAFIDKEYKKLLDCNAKTKIIKCGKKGCIYKSNEMSFPVYSEVIENVIDKTGAGDCLNGVFLNLLVNGSNEKKALTTAVKVATESIKKRGIFSLKLNIEKNRLKDEKENKEKEVC